MRSLPEARALARDFAAAASSGDAAGWAVGLVALAGLDGRSWLLLDEGARTFTYGDGTPVSGVQGWLGPSLAEATGFVAAVTSLHADGRFRERAVRGLAEMSSEVAVPAVTVRLLDHVAQVREAAWEALEPHLRADTAEAVLDVLLAGAGRRHARVALDRVTAALLEHVPAEALVARLVQGDRRQVRRWAFRLGHDRGLLTGEQLVRAARGDADQWVQAVCAGWLMQAPDSGVLSALLDARSVEARLIGLTRVPDSSLDDTTLHRLLLDRAPRVRDLARSRAHRRHVDVAGFYRRTLADGGLSPRAVVACLDGLAGTGEPHDLEAAVMRLRHPSGRVRAAAVAAVQVGATREDAVALLTPTLVDPSGRVSSAAARALARLGVAPSAAETAWASELPSSRRAGWRLARAAGGWHRVEADLRAAVDTDPQVAGLGLTGLQNWLDISAATTWQPLSPEHRERLASWLPTSGLNGDQQKMLAFHAGIDIPHEGREASSETEAPADPPTTRSGWLRLFRHHSD